MLCFKMDSTLRQTILIRMLLFVLWMIICLAQGKRDFTSNKYERFFKQVLPEMSLSVTRAARQSEIQFSIGFSDFF